MNREGKKKVKITIMVLVTLLICIGFGLLASSLYLNSNFLLRKNSWNVYLNNVVVDSNSVSTENNASIDPNNDKLVNFSASFEEPGDYYGFSVDVNNSGSVDVMVGAIKFYVNGEDASTSALANYFDYTITYSDGITVEPNQLLKSGDSETIKVKISFNYDISNEDYASIPAGGLSGNFSLETVYLPSDSNAIKRLNGYQQYYVNKIKENTNNVEQVNISTTDHENELRFIGPDPNNYVVFNNEASCDSNQENCTDVKWRIIGVFDGKLKLVRESIGSYSWDTSGTDVNNGYGVNQWGPSTYTDTTQYDGADLMKLLNPGYESNQDLQCKTSVTNTNDKFHCGEDSASDFNEGIAVNNSLYWNGGSGLCYDWGSYRTKSCNFSSTGLTDTASRNMIDDATWYLGSNHKNTNIWTNDNFNGQAVYTWERQNTNLGKQCSNATYCSDTVNRTPLWTGKVGLMYPSDYIYATAGGNTYNRDTCLAKSSGYSDGSWNNWSNTYTDCYSNDWLKPTSLNWSLSSRARSGYSSYVFDVDSSGCVGHYNANAAGAVRPVVFIKSSVTITGGNGTQSSPYYFLS